MQTKKNIIKKYLAFHRFINSDMEYRLFYSEVLNRYMVITENKIFFDDGVEYEAEELACIKDIPVSMLVTIHSAKKIFGEEVKISDRMENN